MVEEKETGNYSNSETLKETSPSMSDKASLHSQSATAEKTTSTEPPKEDATKLKKVMSAAEAQAELNRVMSTGEGIEYPTGVKLGLITLALCLSVFLMALVSLMFIYFCFFGCTWVNSLPRPLVIAAQATQCPHISKTSECLRIRSRHTLANFELLG
jgi:hypothetical protein